MRSKFLIRSRYALLHYIFLMFGIGFQLPGFSAEPTNPTKTDKSNGSRWTFKSESKINPQPNPTATVKTKKTFKKISRTKNDRELRWNLATQSNSRSKLVLTNSKLQSVKFEKITTVGEAKSSQYKVEATLNSQNTKSQNTKSNDANPKSATFRHSTGGIVNSKAPISFNGSSADGIALYYSMSPTGYPVSGGNRFFLQEPSSFVSGLFIGGPAVSQSSFYPMNSSNSENIFSTSEVKKAVTGSWLGTLDDGSRRDTIALFNQNTCRLHASVHWVEGTEDLIYEIPNEGDTEFCSRVQILAGRWGSTPNADGDRVCASNERDLPAVYDPKTGEYIFYKLAESIVPEVENYNPIPLIIQSRVQFGPLLVDGQSEPLALSGDWNGDGCDDMGLYIAATGVFFLKEKLAPGAADHAFPFGSPNLIPLAGNWDGVGVDSSNRPKGDTIAVYNSLDGKSEVYLRNKLAPGAADRVVSFGPAYVGYPAVPLSGRWYFSPKISLVQPLPAREKTSATLASEVWGGSQILLSGTLGMLEQINYDEGGLVGVREVVLTNSGESVVIRDYTGDGIGNPSSASIKPIGQTQLLVKLPNELAAGSYSIEVKSVRGSYLFPEALSVIKRPLELAQLVFYPGLDSNVSADHQVVLPSGGACVLDEEVALGNSQKQFRSLNQPAQAILSVYAQVASSEFSEPLTLYNNIDACLSDHDGTSKPFAVGIPAGSSHGYYSLFYPEIQDEQGNLVAYDVLFTAQLQGTANVAAAPLRRVHVVPESIIKNIKK